MYIVEVQAKGKGNAPGPWQQWHPVNGPAAWSTRDMAKNLSEMYFGRSATNVRIRLLAETER